jgi:hypothetical protein
LKKTGILISHWNGRFGNRMHQYAYAAHYSKTFGIDCILPSQWEGTHLFNCREHRILDDDRLRLLLNQTIPGLDNLQARSRAIGEYNRRTGSSFEHLNPDDPRENQAGKRAVFIDSVCAYHPSIFQNMSKKYLRDRVFVFNDEVRNTDHFKKYSSLRGTYDVAHLRRDDIANPEYNKNNVQGYSVMSKGSYIRGFIKFGYDPEKIEWVSDDYLSKWHYNRQAGKKGGWSYPVGSEYLGPELIFDWLPDFIKLYFARTIFRANSSFSWWAGFLSPVARVFSPIINRQIIYGRDSLEEVDYEFVEGNHPHWMYGCGDIVFKEDARPRKTPWLSRLSRRLAPSPTTFFQLYKNPENP